MDSLGEFFKLLNIVMSYIGGLGVLLCICLRAKIKNYFDRDIKELQQKHTKELENHKTKLMVDLELAKFNIDLKRSMTMEIMNKKLIAYQDVIGNMRFTCSLIQQWNRNPSTENREKIFGGKAHEIGWDQVQKIVQSSFFIGTPSIEKIWKETAGLNSLIQEQVNLAKKIDDDVIDRYSKSINKLKKKMMESLLNDDLLKFYDK